MRKPIDRIKGFLERRNALFIDFSEPYVFNYVPSFYIDGDWYHLDRITLRQDGTLLFDATATTYRTCPKTVALAEDKLITSELKDIADWLNTYRQYINRHAQIAKYPEK